MGSTTVKMDGNPIMLKGSVFATSTGDEAGSVGGVVSNVIKGKAEFLNYSFDVKVEGKNVPRLLDPMGQNESSPPNGMGPANAQPPVSATPRSPRKERRSYGPPRSSRSCSRAGSSSGPPTQKSIPRAAPPIRRLPPAGEGHWQKGRTEKYPARSSAMGRLELLDRKSL